MFDRPIGPVQLLSGGVDLGLIMGGATLKYDETTVETKADITGDNARGIYVIGDIASITGAVTEVTLDQFAKMSGGVKSGTSTEQVLLSSRVGTDLRALAEEIILKPLVGRTPDANPETWTYMPSGVIVPKWDVNATYGTQRTWAIEITGSPVNAADIASGGHLYNSGSPVWAVGDTLKLGLATV